MVILLLLKNKEMYIINIKSVDCKNFQKKLYANKVSNQMFLIFILQQNFIDINWEAKAQLKFCIVKKIHKTIEQSFFKT